MTENRVLLLNGKLDNAELCQFVFQREKFSKIQVADTLLAKTQKNHETLLQMIDKGLPIYGVTTGFGDSCNYYIDQEAASQLQYNLIQYLSCGQGEFLPQPA